MRNPIAINVSFAGLVLALALELGLQSAFSQTASSVVLARNHFRSGEDMLQAFAPISAATRDSIVKFYAGGEAVALGTIVDTNGLALTKASELKKGKLTCWLAGDQEVDAEVVRVDEEEDLALVRVNAPRLKPILWAENEVQIGEWAITPGIARTPHAVGIISALPRKIKPQRAFIGVEFDSKLSIPKVKNVVSGLGAEKAGIKSGDLISAVNSTEVTNRMQVVDILREFHDGQMIKLHVKRDEEEFDAEIQMKAPITDEFSDELFPQRRFNRLRGEVSQRAEGFEQAIEHDTVLQPWLCGGPLVNLDGKAIGINIARAGRVTTYALSAKVVQSILTKFKADAGLLSTPAGVKK